ncbi:MAG TPA: adenylate/guanylate cyclase domain-containing protein [Rhodocyclaceae bacterium]|nr:adenylate/guanylate cyclase domain-containing protein [Rhodocyclaceae bacterium]
MDSAQRPCCLVFADVANSTGLYERLGDGPALRAVEHCLSLVTQVAASYGGQLVKTIGDEVMLAFPSADRGLLAACEMQQRVAAEPPFSGAKLAVRIGAHWGPVIEEKSDYFGDTVNTAARLTDLAKAEQIIVSAEALAAVPVALRPSARPLATLNVRGKQEPLSVVEVLWRGDVELTLVADRPSPAVAHRAALRLSHRGKEWLLDAAHPRITIGRERDNDLAVSDGRASRHHALVELRQDNVVLIDQSTNGTYVASGTGGFVLHREETVLRGQGHLSFGQLWQPEGVEDISFQVLE